MAFSAIVLLGLLALASAAPQCSTSCNPSQKLAYVPGNTYTYDYTGKHTINIDGADEVSATSDYSATVTLTQITPCDAAISIQNVAGTNIPDIQEEQVQKYPLMVSFTNGKIEKVCSHPEDDVASINVKKAVASAFQSVIPTLEPTLGPQLYTEEDNVGICPTKYAVEAEEDKTVVTKEKIHSNCQEHYYNQTRSSLLPVETPLPIQDSRSSCIMEITNGLYSSIKCTDTKDITPGFGIFKVVKAAQEITLQLVSESAGSADLSSIEEQELNSQSLQHQQELPIKNPALIPKIDAIMPEICTLTQGQGNKQVASLVSQVIELLRFVPDDAVVEVLDKIRAGQYCPEYTKLESLFLDAVAFVGEPGAFKVMAQEIAADRTSGGRLSLYTIAVNLLTRPTLNHVAALKPIFGMTESNQLLNLATSTVVNRFCTQNVKCFRTAPVKEILQLLVDKLDTQCTPDFSNVETSQVLTTLKSIGNIGVNTQKVYTSLGKCVKTEGVETNVRFAAAMSFKGLNECFGFPEYLKGVALDGSMSTEVRIGSYLGFIQCSTEQHLEEIINAMSSESNEQVQGFIMTHLQNLAETNWPMKQQLREMLSWKIIPNIYKSNIFKYSRNIEMSVNEPITELGGLVESNIVYTPESYVPRLVNLGLNMNLLGSFINIGEVGVRVEGFDTYFDDAIGPNSYLYKEVFGPDSYLYKTPLWSVIEDSKLFMTQRGTEILQQIQTLIKENNINPDTIIKAVNKIIKNSKNANADSILKAFNKVLNNAKNIDIESAISSIDFESIIKSIIKFLETNKFQLPKTYLYAIVRAQERGFLSFGGEKKSFTIQKLIDSVIPVIMNAVVGAQNLNVEATRTGQINIDYSIPTISGIPLKLKLTGTGVADIKMRHNLNVKPGDVDALLQIIPSLSVQIEGQVGFGEFMNTGLKLRSSAYTTNGFALNVIKKNGGDLELQLDLPMKMEIIDIDSELFFMKLDQGPDSNEIKLIPNYIDGSRSGSSDCLVRAFDFFCYDLEGLGSGSNDIRMKSTECSSIIEPLTGLNVCYKMNLQDITYSESLPLSEPMIFKVYLEKSDAAMKGYRLTAKLKNKPKNKLLKIVAGTYGSAKSKDSTFKLSYTKEEATHLVAITFQSTFYVSTSEFTFINQPDYKSLQYYTNKDIGKMISGEGSFKIDYRPIVVDNGITYNVATYAGLTKSLNPSHKFFQVSFSQLKYGENTDAVLLTEIYQLPVPISFEARVTLPSNAGLRIYKLQKVSLVTTLHTANFEAVFQKKSSEEYQMILNIKNSGTVIATFDAINTISIESPLTGFSATKLKLGTYATAKLPSVPILQLSGHSKFNYENGMIATSAGIKHRSLDIVDLTSTLNLDITSPELTIRIAVPVASLNLRVGYTNGVLEGSSVVKDMNSETIFSASLIHTLNSLPLTCQAVIKMPNVFLVDFFHTLGPDGITTEALVDAPALIKPIKVKNTFEIIEMLKYSFLTDVTSGDSVILHMEGPLTFSWDMHLGTGETYVLRNLDLKITGAFDGAFNILGLFGMNENELEYSIDVSHTSTPIVYFGVFLDKSNDEEVAGKVKVNVPYAIESEVATTLSTSLIHSTMNVLVLPSTNYARRFKGDADFNYAQNNFKGELFWDAENDNEKKIELSLNYACVWCPMLLVQGELTVATLTYGYKLESVHVHLTPFDFLQGIKGLQFTLTMPSEEMAVAKAMFDVAYDDSQLTLQPLLSIITISEKYELSSTLVAKLLPGFLNFDVTCKSTVSTPQLNQIMLISKFMHEDKDQSGKLALTMTLKESVLNEATSLEYILESAPSTLKITRRAMYGKKEVALVTDIVISGLKSIEIIQELKLPLRDAESLIVKVNIYTGGSILFDFKFNNNKIVNINYNMQDITNHNLAIRFIGSRHFFFIAMIYDNQVTFEFYPEKNKNERVVEVILRATPKARATQFEALLTATSLSKEMRFAVETELIEPDDLLSIDVQYQVSEVPKLLKASLKELQNIYSDLSSDENLVEILSTLNNIRNDLKVMISQFYDNLKNYVLNLYQLHEDDLIALWNKVQSEFLVYWNIIKTEVPLLLEKYAEVIKKSEAWNAIWSILNEVMVNYPAYYEAVVAFYNEIIVKYLNQLSETISRLLEQSEIDFQKYLAIVIYDVPELLIRFTQRILDTQLVKDLRKTYPVVFEAAEDIYTKLVMPTSIDIMAVIQKLAAVPFDFQVYWKIIQDEVPAIATQFGQRLQDTKIIINLRDAFPTIFEVADDLYSKVIIPTFADILAFIGKLIALPILDFQEYWNVIKAEVPTLFNNFVERLPNTQLVNELKMLLPTVFEVSEDFYKMVILPTTDDVVAVVDKLAAVPIKDIQRAFKKYWNILKVEVPTLTINFIQRIPNTQAINLLQTNLDQLSSFLQIKFNELKGQYPELHAVLLDFYTKVVVPAISDLPMLYNKIIKITDINQLRDFITMDVLSFVNNLLKNISTTDLFSKLMAVFDEAVAAFTEENFGLVFSFSAGGFTAVVPLPVSVNTLRNYWERFRRYAPRYVAELVWRGLYIINTLRDAIYYIYYNSIDYIYYTAPIHLEYIMDYVQMLQVAVPQFINDFPSYLDAAEPYIDMVLDVMDKYAEIVVGLFERYYKMAYRRYEFVRVAQDNLEYLLQSLFENLEITFMKAIYFFVYIQIYADLIMDFATWAVNPIMEYPAVRVIIDYLSPENAPDALNAISQYVMTALGPVQTAVNELIATLIKEIPAFVEFHIPKFVMPIIEYVIENVVNFFNLLERLQPL